MSLDQTTIKGMITQASEAELELVWIPRIMNNQTRDEIDYENTLERNGMGLNGRDAPFITDLYDTVINGRHLTSNQAIAVRRVLVKYSRQYSEMTQET